MPRIPRASDEAQHPHADSDQEFGRGWCLPCYREGAFTLATDPSGTACVVHGLLVEANADAAAAQQQTEQPRTWPGGVPRRSRPPRGRGARSTAPPTRRQPRPRTLRRQAARQVAKAMAYGRRRAAARVTGPGYAPHPGWRNLIADDWRVLTDQAEALSVVEALVDAEDWRSDKRAAWTSILRKLVFAMDWESGLVAALTAEKLGAAGGRAPRTISRVIAWAREKGLVVVVEHAASAEFLGTERGRTPTYALVTDGPGPQRVVDNPPPPEPNAFSLVSEVVEDIGDPPVSNVQIKPLSNRRLKPANSPTPQWPFFAVPDSPTKRSSATSCLLHRLGLDGAGVSGVPLWRTRALLKPWWEAGASPAGLLWAIDHHPDQPAKHRGDALRGARDPLRVLGARLRPWQDRLGELPAAVVGIRGNHHREADRRTATTPREPQSQLPTSSSSARDAARAAVAKHLSVLRQRRRAGGAGAAGTSDAEFVRDQPRSG